MYELTDKKYVLPVAVFARVLRGGKGNSQLTQSYKLAFENTTCLLENHNLKIDKKLKKMYILKKMALKANFQKETTKSLVYLIICLSTTQLFIAQY